MKQIIAMLFVLIAFNAQAGDHNTYNIAVAIDKLCGDADGNGVITATDALIANKLAVQLQSEPGQCEFGFSDSIGLDETVVLDPTKSPTYSPSSHGVVFFSDTCVDIDGNGRTQATDALATLRAAVDLGWPDYLNECRFVFVDTCPGEDQGSYGLTGKAVILDKPGQGTGIATVSFDRYILDDCEQFPARGRCEADRIVAGQDMRRCKWVEDGIAPGCYPKDVWTQRCLRAQANAGIN